VGFDKSWHSAEIIVGRFRKPKTCPHTLQKIHRTKVSGFRKSQNVFKPQLKDFMIYEQIVGAKGHSLRIFEFPEFGCIISVI
jgi:hypothetical protein